MDTLCPLPYQRGITPFGDYYSVQKFEIKFLKFVIFTYTLHLAKKKFPDMFDQFAGLFLI